MTFNLKFFLWVGVGLWIVPQIEKRISVQMDRKRFGA